MELLQTILALLVTLGILVTVQTRGRTLFLARYFGVRVLRFSLGMGPVLAAPGSDGDGICLGAFCSIGGWLPRCSRGGGCTLGACQRASAKPTPRLRIAIAPGGRWPISLALLVYWVLFVSGVTGLVPHVKALEGAEGARVGRSDPRRRWPGNAELERGCE